MKKAIKIILMSAGGLFLLLMLIFALGVMLDDDDNTDSNTTATTAPPEPIKSKWDIWQEKYVSGWDGSCRPLEKYIKKQLNDPDSYEHSETRYYVNDDTTKVNVLTIFRAKNGFGGLILTSYAAELDMSGNILKLSEVRL